MKKIHLLSFVFSVLSWAAPSAHADPTTEPLVQSGNLQYVGAFRVPANVGFAAGGGAFTYNPINNSLYIGNWNGPGGTVDRIAEVSIPSSFVNSPDLTTLPVATLLQPMSDPTDGHLTGSNISANDLPGDLEGLLVANGKLYGSAYDYYDANNAARVSHYVRNLNLSVPSFAGWYTVWNSLETGFVSGAMATVPSEWQPLLGGPALTSNWGIPIVSRTSYGPDAFAFDPATLTGSAYPNQPTPVPAVPLVYYPGDHPTLGSYNGQNAVYGMASNKGGLVIPAGTRSLLVFGTNGTAGHACYGPGTSDPALAGTPDPQDPQWNYCYDPVNSAQGSHAYPYNYFIWAYDLNDLAAAKAGTKNPWDVVPYATWTINFPDGQFHIWGIGGIGYDAANQRIYVSEKYGDSTDVEYRPVIHVFTINNANLPDPAVIVEPNNQAAAVGQTATFQITASGTPPLTYQWQKSGDNGITWINVGTNSNSYTTPAGQLSDSGTQFRCKVTNGTGVSILSTVAILTVTAGTPPPPPPPPPVPGGLPNPDLSSLPSYLATNGTLSLANGNSFSNVTFFWSISSSTGNVPYGGNMSAVSQAAAGVSFQSGSASASLSSYHLSPGYYVVSVYAQDNTNSSQHSNTISKGVTLVAADFSGLRVFPNPWRSDKHAGPITFDHLPLGCTVKIFTVSGHWVANVPLTADPTVATWNLTNDSGDKVASGIYVYLIKVGDSGGYGGGGQKTTGKVVVIK